MTLRFEYTTDTALVRSILTLPRIYRRLGDDSKPAAKDFRVRADHRASWVLAKTERASGETAAALFMLVPIVGGRVECHFCVLPQFWGRGIEIVRAFVEWVWKNTRYRKITGPIRGDNRLALKLAREAGFSVLLVKAAKLMRYGKPVDEVIVGLDRPKVKHHVPAA